MKPHHRSSNQEKINLPQKQVDKGYENFLYSHRNLMRIACQHLRVQSEMPVGKTLKQYSSLGRILDLQHNPVELLLQSINRLHTGHIKT